MNREEINADIKKNGKKIFEYIRDLVIKNATIPSNGNIQEHENNKQTIKFQIRKFGMMV